MPEYHEPLVPNMLDHLHTDSLDRNNYCSDEVIPDIMLGNCDLHSEPFIVNIVSAQTTFRESRFDIKGLEEPQYYFCQ